MQIPDGVSQLSHKVMLKKNSIISLQKDRTLSELDFITQTGHHHNYLTILKLVIASENFLKLHSIVEKL